MIYKEYVVIVDGNEATINEPVYLYKYDQNVELRFNVNSANYKYTDTNNILDQISASYCQVRFINTLTKNKYTFAVCPTINGQAVLRIKGELIDEEAELGIYDFQIRLLDESKNSIASLPPIKGAIHIEKPLFDNDANSVGKGAVGVTAVSTNDEGLETFDKTGNYNKTTWLNGDIISKDRLNKIEDAIDQVNVKAETDKNNKTYIMSSFTQNDLNLKIWISNNGINWTKLSEGYVGTNGVIRDPSIVKFKDCYVVAYTNKSFQTVQDFGIAKSYDLINWEHVVDVPVGNPYHTWAPELFVDGNTLRCYVSLGSSSADDFQIYELHTSNLVNWSSPVKCTGNLPHNIIDASLVKKDGKYYLFYKNENTKYIEYAVSNDGVTNYSVRKNGDWALWGNNLEGVCILKKPGGGYRVYFDAYGKYKYYYSDSDENLENWTPKAEIKCNDTIRHCTVLTTNLNQDIFTALTVKINKGANNSIQTINLGTGTTEELTLKRNALYFVDSTNNITIKSINLSNLSVGDKVGFACFSGSQKSFIKILKNSNTLPVKDFIISTSKNNSDRIFYATVAMIKNVTYLVFEGLTSFNSPSNMATLAAGTIETYSVIPNGCYEINGTKTCTINNIDHSSLLPGECCYFCLRSASPLAYIEIKSSSTTSVVMPGGSLKLCTANANNDKIITLMKFGSELRVKD